MIIVLDNIRSALNVGSIIRTCDAFGVTNIYICGLTPPETTEKVKKTSLGAEKTISFKHFRTTLEAIQELKNEGKYVVGLEINEEAKDISKAILQNKDFALVVGNEVSGIAPEVLKKCDLVVKIPMKGVKESLNVSVAFGISLYALLS